MEKNLNPLYEGITDDFGVHVKDARYRHAAMAGGPIGVALARMVRSTRSHRTNGINSTRQPKLVQKRVKVKKVKQPKQRLGNPNWKDSTGIFSGDRLPEQYR